MDSWYLLIETVKLMEYGIKEIDRELFEIEAKHFENSILFKIVVKWADYCQIMQYSSGASLDL